MIFLEISDEQVIERLTGRLYAPKSGFVYHVKNKPSKKEGVCDASGEPLIARPDDTKEVIQSRLNIFYKETKPLLDYYKKQKLLHVVNANRSPEEVFHSIISDK